MGSKAKKSKKKSSKVAGKVAGKKSGPKLADKLKKLVAKGKKTSSTQKKAAKSPQGKKAPKKAAGKTSAKANGKSGAKASAKGTTKGGKKISSAETVKQLLASASQVPSVENEVRAAKGLSACREIACTSNPTTAGYCRLHYVKNWKKIKKKDMILKEGKLNKYIEELVSKYPEKYIEAIRNDLVSDKDFSKVVSDLELDEGGQEVDFDSDSIDSLIESIRKDVDDEETY